MTGLTIVSGFLGAGKTTLLRQLIKRSLERGERVAVIENEFGSVSLDGPELAALGVPVVELNQGCICCSLRAEFSAALDRLLGAAPPPERIFFEPSGVFVPDVLLDLLADPALRARCRLDSFVTVVDACRLVRGNPHFRDFLLRQAGPATWLALSKTEGLDPAALALCDETLAALNSQARRVAVPAAGIDSALLDQFIGFEQPQQTPPPEPAVRPRFRLKRSAAAPGHGIASCAIEIAGPLPPGTLAGWMRELSSGRFGTVLRAKGHAVEAGLPVRCSLVEDDAELVVAETPGGGWGRLVVIGDGLDFAAIRSHIGGTRL